MLRTLAYAGACAVALLLTPSYACADTIAVRSGNGFLYWDGSLTSITLVADGSKFSIEPYAGSDSGFSGGVTVDLSTTIPVTNGGNHPLAQTYHGQDYRAWVSGSLQITARPFVAPHAPASADGTYQSFTTTFELSGTITAYSTSDRTSPPLFSTSVTGHGIMTAGPYRIGGDSYLQRSGDGLSFFSPTSPLCSSWSSADVGAVGVLQGYGRACDDPMAVYGSGADIWGRTDAFQLMSQPVAADGTLVAQLRSPVQSTFSATTSSYAKGGLMLRQSLDPSAPHVILDVRPGGGIEFMTRSSAGGTIAFLAGGSTQFPVWLKLSRSAGLVTGATSSDGTAWTTIGTTADPTAADALIGFAVTSHDAADRDVATFSGSGLSRLPPGWSHDDVGITGREGNATETDGLFTVSGAGADIWGSADAFTSVTRPVGSDTTLIARVVDEQHTHMFAKAGLAIGALTADAARVILDVRPDGNVEFMARLTDGGAMSFIAGASTTLPVWLKLVRAGDQFTASISPNGSTWTTVGAVSAMMAATLRGGLAVTSHEAAVLNTSTFDNVTMATSALASGGQNLLNNPGFESSAPPALGSAGWVSDAFRQTPAQLETGEPHTGSMNASCRATAAMDCGLYQDVTAPTDGTYTFTTFANASRPGVSIGVNLNGATVRSAPVDVRGTGAYGAAYSLSFAARAGDSIRVWLYSPSTPGSAVIDDTRLSY